jgi:transposase InsO family protein
VIPGNDPGRSRTEFVSRDLDVCAYERGVTLDFSRPGKPTDNAFIEAFNGPASGDDDRLYRKDGQDFAITIDRCHGQTPR